MAHQKVQVRYGTTSELSSIVPDIDEVTLNRTTGNLHIGDGIIAGGKWRTVSYNPISTSATRGISVEQYSSDALAAQFNAFKYRGTLAAPTTVANGDFIGSLVAWPYDGTNSLSTGAIAWKVNGIVATGSVPTDFIIYTGSTSLVERFRIDSAGNVGINNSAPARTVDVTGIVRSSSEFQSTNPFGVFYRMVTGTYGSFWYSDTANMYFLITNSGDQYGTFNSLRPFNINLSSGVVGMGHGLNLTGGNIAISNGQCSVAGAGSIFLTYDRNGSGNSGGMYRNSGILQLWSVNYGTIISMSDNSGMVGIGGVTSPANRVQIVSIDNSLATDIIRFNYDASNNYRSGIGVSFDGGTVANNQMRFRVSNGTTTGQAVVLTLYGNSTSSFNGNVGIGIAVPRNTLELWGSGTTGLTITDSSVTTDSKSYDWILSGTALTGRLVNDAYSSAVGWQTITRTGMTVTSITHNATTHYWQPSGAAYSYGYLTSTTAQGAFLALGPNASTGDVKIKLGIGRTGNGYAYIDLIGDTTYSDYGLRLVRGNTGANAESYIDHRGTGNLNILVTDAGWIAMSTSATGRMYINPTGLVGIGTATLGASKLTVNGRVAITDDGNAFGSTVNGIHFVFSSNVGIIYSIENGVAWRNLYIDGAVLSLNSNSTGNVGIHTFTPLDILHIYDNRNSAVVHQLLLQNEGAGSNTAAIAFQVASSGEYTSLGPKAGIAFQRTNTNGRGLLKFYNRSTNDTAAYAAGDERFLIGNGLYSLNATGGDKGNDTINIGTYYSIGHAMMANDGTYNFLYDGQGNQSVFLGPTADPTNYYRNTGHIFGNIAGAATYLTFGNAGQFHYNHTYPGTDNTYTFGDGSHRWTALYAVNGTIQTSDERDKILLGCDLGLDFICSLKPQSWNWKVGKNKVIDQIPIKNEFGHIIGHDMVLESEPGRRRHYGLVAQQVKEVLGDKDFGGWVLDNPDDPDSLQSLRMDQFIAPLIASVKELREMVAIQAAVIQEMKQTLH